MFRPPLCPSSGASQLHMQSLVPINYKNTCCLQVCHYVHFIITTDYLCGTYKAFFNLCVGFVLFCFVLGYGSVGFVSCIILLLHTVWCLVRCVLQSCYVVTVTTQQDWRTQRTKHHTGPETACAAEKFLMMDTMVSETCRAE